MILKKLQVPVFMARFLPNMDMCFHPMYASSWFFPELCEALTINVIVHTKQITWNHQDATRRQRHVGMCVQRARGRGPRTLDMSSSLSLMRRLL